MHVLISTYDVIPTFNSRKSRETDTPRKQRERQKQKERGSVTHRNVELGGEVWGGIAGEDGFIGWLEGAGLAGPEGGGVESGVAVGGGAEGGLHVVGWEIEEVVDGVEQAPAVYIVDKARSDHFLRHKLSWENAKNPKNTISDVKFQNLNVHGNEAA